MTDDEIELESVVFRLSDAAKVALCFPQFVHCSLPDVLAELRNHHLLNDDDSINERGVSVSSRCCAREMF